MHLSHILCRRYATTLVTSEVRNPELEAREVFLSVILPDTAFISRFAIELGGQLFVAFVKEKEEAWREYQSAVDKGKTAGTGYIGRRLIRNAFIVRAASSIGYLCKMQSTFFSSGSGPV